MKSMVYDIVFVDANFLFLNGFFSFPSKDNLYVFYTVDDDGGTKYRHLPRKDQG